MIEPALSIIKASSSKASVDSRCNSPAALVIKDIVNRSLVAEVLSPGACAVEAGVVKAALKIVHAGDAFTSVRCGYHRLVSSGCVENNHLVRTVADLPVEEAFSGVVTAIVTWIIV